MSTRRRMKERAPALELRCVCGQRLQKYWPHCPNCARELQWKDHDNVTGAECYNCGWVVSDKFSYCPWCAADIYEEGYSSETRSRRPRGSAWTPAATGAAAAGCSIRWPTAPGAGGAQTWNEDRTASRATAPTAAAGVDDWMNACPWCGNDATGRDLIPRALTRVRRLLLVSRIRDWGYRVLLRPGISGVDPRYPKIVEIEQRYVVGKRRQDEIPWTMLVGLLTHELGHSFLYHHWDWTRSRRFRRAFGEVDKAYRGMDNTWVYFQRRRIAIAPRDHVSTYAAKHPQEDFAETFRFYVTRRGRLRDLFAEFGQKRKGVILYEKFLVLHDFVRALRGWA